MGGIREGYVRDEGRDEGRDESLETPLNKGFLLKNVRDDEKKLFLLCVTLKMATIRSVSI